MLRTLLTKIYDLLDRFDPRERDYICRLCDVSHTPSGEPNGPVRRVCLYGGPGAGKSVEAARIFSLMKIQHRKVELVQEWIKMWAYEKKTPESFDQVYVFSKQQRAEDRVLRKNRVEFTVSDSPLFLSCCYAKKFQTPGWKQLMELSDIFDAHFKPLHIYIDRGQKPYNPEGRYQDYEQAQEMDRFIRRELDETGKKYHIFETMEVSELNKLLEE